MSTLLTLNGVTFPAALGLPKFPLDGLDATGVRLIHDYRRTRCLAPGPLVEGQAIGNLSRSGVPDGVLAGADHVTRDGQGLRFSRPSGGTLTNYIRANGDGGIGIGSTQSFVAIAWVQQRVAVDYQGVIGTAGNGLAADGADSNNQWGLLINASGSVDPYGITCWVWDSAGVKIQVGMPQVMPVNGGVHQIGMAVVHTPGDNTYLYLVYDGVIKFETPLGGVRGLWGGAGFPLQVGTVGTANQGAMTIYRTSLTYLGAGQDPRTPAQVFARDYALNAGQFS